MPEPLVLVILIYAAWFLGAILLERYVLGPLERNDANEPPTPDRNVTRPKPQRNERLVTSTPTGSRMAMRLGQSRRATPAPRPAPDPGATLPP